MRGKISRTTNRAHTLKNMSFSLQALRALEEVDDLEARRQELRTRARIEMRERMLKGDYGGVKESYPGNT